MHLNWGTTENVQHLNHSERTRDIDSKSKGKKDEENEKKKPFPDDVSQANVSLTLCMTNTCHLKWPT